MAPTTGYQTPQGYSNLGLESTIPSASASGSVGLSALRIGSNGSEPNTPTTHHSDAHGPQPGDRDCYRRLVIKPVGYGISPDEGWAGTIRKCVGTDYNGVYPSLGSIPLRTQGQMFNEFKKYYVWSPEHEEQIQVNFKNKATKVLANIFCTSRKINQRPTFVEPQLWAKLQEFWNTDEKFKKRSEIGKEARASEKGGSLHTGGAISQLTRKKRMEEELGREVPQAELFKVTHIKKMINPTDEESWIEPRAKETHDRYVQKVQYYLSTLPPESRDAPRSQEVTERLWRESAGEPVRGIVYGYPEKVYHEKKSWFYCSSSSDIDGVDKTTVSKMEDKISLLTAELAAVADREKERDEREKKREEQVAASKEVENKRFVMLQAQLKSLFDCGIIIPPSPSDKRRGQVDETEEESEDDEE